MGQGGGGGDWTLGHAGSRGVAYNIYVYMYSCISVYMSVYIYIHMHIQCVCIYIYILTPPPIYSPNVALLQLRCIAKTCLSSLHCECSFCGTVQQFCTDTSATAVLFPKKNHQKANKLCCPNKAQKNSLFNPPKPPGVGTAKFGTAQHFATGAGLSHISSQKLTYPRGATHAALRSP